MDLGAFEKFDPPVSGAMRRYVLAQFGVAVAATLGIAAVFAASGAMAVLLPCVMLWVLLYTLGLLNEGRRYAVRLELARVLVIVPAGMLGIVLTELLPVPSSWLWMGTAAYLAASLAGLHRAMQVEQKSMSNQELIADK